MNPTPEQIKQSRMDAGLTQTAAALHVYKTCRAWQQYEKGDRAMDLALFELFMIKVEKEEARLTRFIHLPLLLGIADIEICICFASQKIAVISFCHQLNT